MNNQYDDDFDRPKQRTPYIKLVLIAIVLMALAGGAYVTIFSPQLLISTPTISPIHSSGAPTTQNQQNTRTATQNNDFSMTPPSTFQPSYDSFSTQNNTEQETTTDALNTAFALAEGHLNNAFNSTNENLPQNDTPSTIETTDNNPDDFNNLSDFLGSANDFADFDDFTSTEDNLRTTDMKGASLENLLDQVPSSSDHNASVSIANLNNPNTNTTSIAQKNTPEQTNPKAPIVQKTPVESTQSTNTFELAPPTNSALPAKIELPTEEELAKKKQEQDEIILAQLKEVQSKPQESTISEEEKKVLPTMAIPVTTVEKSKSDEDPILTDTFISSLANLLVNSYNSKQNIVNTKTISAAKISQSFGTTMNGLVHPMGREGVLKYTYQPRILEKVADFVSPRLIDAMQISANKSNMTQDETVKMYHTYGNHVNQTAAILVAITGTKGLDANINDYLTKEKKMLDKKTEFAETMMAFEATKLEGNDTKSLERKMSTLSKEAADLEKEFNTARITIPNNVKKAFPAINSIKIDNSIKNEEILELALWLHRRNNPAANQSAINALKNFAAKLNQQ